jgi:hypothetical protein
VGWRAAIDFENTTTLSAPSLRRSSGAVAIQDATICGREAWLKRAGGADEVFLVNRLAWLSRGPRGSLPAVAEVDLPPNFAGSAAERQLDLKLPCDDRVQRQGENVSSLKPVLPAEAAARPRAAARRRRQGERAGDLLPRLGE